MLTSRTIILFCLILLFAVGTNLFVEQSNNSYANPVFAKNDPDLYMLNALITQFTKTGSRQHKIRAERLTHFPLTDITTLKMPTMTMYSDQKDSKPWDIRADHGRLLPKVQVREEIIELWQQVLARQIDNDGNFINIQTDSLTVYPEMDYLETDQTVRIDDNSGRTIAGGMKAYLQQGRFVFFSSDDQRVTTILLPVFE